MLRKQSREYNKCAEASERKKPDCSIIFLAFFAAAIIEVEPVICYG
jgi:hypothetical protein